MKWKLKKGKPGNLVVIGRKLELHFTFSFERPLTLPLQGRFLPASFGHLSLVKVTSNFSNRTFPPPCSSFASQGKGHMLSTVLR